MKYYILKNQNYEEISYQELKKYYYKECQGDTFLTISNMTKDSIYFVKDRYEPRSPYPEEQTTYSEETYSYPVFS